VTAGGTVENGISDTGDFGSMKAFGDGIGGCGIGVVGTPSRRLAKVAALPCLGQMLGVYWMRRGDERRAPATVRMPLKRRRGRSRRRCHGEHVGRCSG
jgi:hypothetical protein